MMTDSLHADAVGALATFERATPKKPMNKVMTNSAYAITDDGRKNRSHSKGQTVLEKQPGTDDRGQLMPGK
jgi:hypothetical protein